MSRIQLFENSVNTLISESHFEIVNEVNNIGITGLQALYQASTPTASFDSAHVVPFTQCHPETRVTILRKIGSWITTPITDNNLSILWLTGPAGAGKSSIAATVCQDLREEHRIFANFFFSQRNGCTDSLPLFTTLAYQLSVLLPNLRQLIEDILRHDPAILSKPIQKQLQGLLIQPLNQLKLLESPIFLIIDGLDECEGEDTQCEIISLLAQLARQSSLPLRFLVFSRPESWIQDEFASDQVSPLTYKISLRQTAESDQDIRLFLRSNLCRIRESRKHRHAMVSAPIEWPSKDVYDTLVDLAGGMFIYPATVIRFIDDPNFSPVDRLANIISGTSLTCGSPIPHLDQLYTSILSATFDPKRSVTIMIAFFILLDSQICKREVIGVLENLLKLGTGGGYRALRSLHSLVYIPESIAVNRDRIEIDEYRVLLESEPPRVYHKSFRDFLLNPERSRTLYISPFRVHSELAVACIKTLMDFKLKPQSRLSWLTWVYARQFWISHCVAGGPISPELRSTMDHFDPVLCCIPQCEAILQSKSNLKSFHKLKDDAKRNSKIIHPDPKDVIHASCIELVVFLRRKDMLFSSKEIAGLMTQADLPRRFEEALRAFASFGTLDYTSQIKMFKEAINGLSSDCWGNSTQRLRMPLPLPPIGDLPFVWEFLEEGILDIFTKQHGTMSASKYSSMYTVVYDVCTTSQPSPPFARRDLGPFIYENLKKLVIERINVIFKNAKSLDHGEFLRLYVTEWSYFSRAASGLKKPLNYLNRDFIKKERDAGKRTIYMVEILPLIEWYNICFDKVGGFAGKLTDALLCEIHKERSGVATNQDDLREAIASLITLGAVRSQWVYIPLSPSPHPLEIYQTHFESAFLASTTDFYTSQSRSYLAAVNPSEYVMRVERWLKQEKDRAEGYLHSSTQKQLMDVCEKCLIQDHLQVFSDALLGFYEQRQEEDIARMGKLLSGVPTGQEVLESIRSIFWSRGLQEELAHAKD